MVKIILPFIVLTFGPDHVVHINKYICISERSKKTLIEQCGFKAVFVSDIGRILQGNIIRAEGNSLFVSPLSAYNGTDTRFLFLKHLFKLITPFA